MPRSRITITLFAGALAACQDSTAPTPRLAARDTPSAGTTPLGGYSATKLPFIPGGINDSGVIVGHTTHDAVRYFNGALVTMPTGSGWNGDYVANAINRRGVIVGNVVGGPGMLWRASNQAPQVIESPSGADFNRAVVPNSVNNLDVVVGGYEHFDRKTSPNMHAFRWTARGGLEDITPPGYENAEARDVNDAGYIVGYAWHDGKQPDAVRWAPNAGNNATVIGGVSKAVAIRADGFAVGSTLGYFVYLDAPYGWSLLGPATNLPGPGSSQVEDVSDAGRVVAFTFPHAPDPANRPWSTRNGVTTWLPVPNDRDTDRVRNLRVNGCGSIIGTQLLTTGDLVGLLWTRVQCDLLAPV